MEGVVYMMRNIFVTLALATSTLVNASDEAQVQKYLMSFKCQYCDLSGVDFSGRQLEGSDLMNANLSSANLSGANLEP